jgi:septum site-determining protein MinD
MSKIISIHSFQGGVGKSSILHQLAIALSKENKVGCIDGDFQSPSFYHLFGVSPNTVSHYLLDYLSENGEENDTPREEKGLSLFFSSPKAVDIVKFLREKYNPPLFVQKIKELPLKRNLDYLLIDTHSGINEENLLFLSVSDVACIVLDSKGSDDSGPLGIAEIAKKMNVPKIVFLTNGSDPQSRIEKRENALKDFGPVLQMPILNAIQKLF